MYALDRTFRLSGQHRETLQIEYLTRDLQPLFREQVPSPCPQLVRVSLRQIIATALALNAEALIVAHDHPAGDCRPSKTDIAVTRRLARLCCDLGIALHDHIVIGATDRFSFRRQGLL